MSLTRQTFADAFKQLDDDLVRLRAIGRPDEDLWEAIDRAVQVPTCSVAPRDRLWWWEQVYKLMERHQLTELSQARAPKDL